MPKGYSPTVRFVRSLPGEYYMVSEAAKMIGVSPHTLRQYVSDPNLSPTKCANFGKVRIYLYTMEDIQKIQNELNERRKVVDFNGERMGKPSGRPSKFSKEEAAHRKRLYAQRYYYTKRAHKLRSEGRDEESSEAFKQAYKIDTYLRTHDDTGSNQD
jgi:DNA-binding transcriptional MerR regulator